MSELQLNLDFDCQECEGSVNITVKCQGQGLAHGPRSVAAVKIPCPHCGSVNQVCFHPTGTVVAVNLMQVSCRLLTPSIN
jgi:hypothetical protein